MHASLADDEKLWPTMADESVVLQLDVLFVLLALLALVHAVKTKGLWSGSTIVLFLGLHTAVFEHLSLFLGGTHCHATSPLLPKISPCSSVNSVLFYIPWIYTSIEAASRVQPKPSSLLGFPFLVGLLQFGFGAVYEMQGPINNFWKWPDESGVIADSVLLEPWDGYTPIGGGLLEDARKRNEVATIARGVFSVSRHAQRALEERLYGFPILAPYFHFAYGFAWALGLVLFGNRATSTSTSSSTTTTGQYTVPSLVVSGLQSTVFFIVPIEITRQLTHVLGLTYSIGVPISLVLSLCPIYLSLKKKKKSTTTTTTKNASTSSTRNSTSPDWLLYSISILMHAFMVSFHLRAPNPTPKGLVFMVTAVATLHLTAQYYCCIMTRKRSETPATL